MFAVGTSGAAMTAEDLHKNVDLAMYAAKAQGKNTYAMFEPSMRRDFDNGNRRRTDRRQGSPTTAGTEMRQLVPEVPENALADDPELISMLARLRATGVRVIA